MENCAHAYLTRMWTVHNYLSNPSYIVDVIGGMRCEIK